MTQESQEERLNEAHKIVALLRRLRNDINQGNAAMAIFRRGLSERAEDIEKMQRFLHRFMMAGDTQANRWREESIFLIASLFALCKNTPEGSEGNMGNHFDHARAKATSDEAVARRFSSLISAHHEDLPVYLRRAATYLKAQDVGIHWAQLLADVWDWRHPDRGERVRRDWARQFWLGKDKRLTATDTESTLDFEQLESESSN